MPEAPTVLVADSDGERRKDLGLSLYQGGYEVINAVNGEEAIRFTGGLDPTLVIMHTGLEGLEPLELHARLSAAGLELPPMLILCHEIPEIDDDHPEGAFYYLESSNIEAGRFLYQVRLLLLAREIGGELNDDIDTLYGDLTRISMGDLLRVLLRFKISGHVKLSLGPEAGIWLSDGDVVEAAWDQCHGRKAFNRIAGLRGGSFVLDLEETSVERAIEADLVELVSDAVDEKFKLDELFRKMPSLNSTLTVRMREDFFSIEFASVEREILTWVPKTKNFAELIDRVTVTDLEVLTTIQNLQDQGFLEFHVPEQRIHIVSDSTCDLLPSLTRRLGISIVPLSILFGKKVFKDGIDIQPDQFYGMLRRSNDFPSTSPPHKGEFLETYRRLVGSGDIISIHISTKQSLTSKHAGEAAEEGYEEFCALRDETIGEGKPLIRIVDSQSDSVGLGLMVIFAARMAAKGIEVDEIVSRLEEIRSRFHFCFLVDTLEFLKKGGRIGAAKALIGTLFGIKPILGVVDGEVTPIDKVRGGRRAHPKMVEILKSRVDPKKPVFAAMAHASAPRWGGRLKGLLEKEFSILEMLEGEIGPVVGAHTGPGTVGVIMFQPTEEEIELFKADDA